MALEMFDDGLGAECVDGCLHFAQMPDTSKVVPIRGHGRGAGRAGLALHDQRRLQTGLRPLHFVGTDPFREPIDLTERHVERFLGTFVGRPGVTDYSA